MSTTKMPGFAAEHPVYRTKADYRTTAGSAARGFYNIDYLLG